MSNRLAVYEGRNVTVVAMAIPIEDGIPQDTFLKITPPEVYDQIESLDGVITRFRKGSRIYLVELTLQASSSHNAVLSALHGADAIATGGAGVGAFFAKDNSGSSLYAAEQMWIMKAPDGEFGASRPDVTWSMVAAADPHTMILGGN
jgi:hypothetical protein